MNGHSDIRSVAHLLADRTRSETPLEFPRDTDDAAKAGLYSWWADREARELFESVARAPVGAMVYVGQAGATSGPSGKESTATLKSRIRSNHIRGNLSSSTFRLTISAMLRGPLNLRLERPGKLVSAENHRVTQWIESHLRVAIVPWNHRDSLGCVEQAVLDVLDPPFNLDGRPPTTLRQRLTDLRRAITQGK